jgi:hypothetical protein
MIYFVTARNVTNLEAAFFFSLRFLRAIKYFVLNVSLLRATPLPFSVTSKGVAA